MALDIFDDSDLEAINSALDKIPDAKELLQRMENAEIDTSTLRPRLEKQEKTLRGIKGSFFPGR